MMGRLGKTAALLAFSMIWSACFSSMAVPMPDDPFMCGGAEAPDVYVLYDDFENDTLQWRPKGAPTTLTVTDEMAYSGRCSLLVTGRESNVHGPELDITHLIENGARYTFSVWVRIKETETEGGVVPFRFGFERRINGQGSSSYVALVNKDVPVGEWVELTATSASSSFVFETLERLRLYIETPNAEPAGATSFYVDRLVITKYEG